MATTRKHSVDSVTDKQEVIEEVEDVPQASGASKGQPIVYGNAALAILGTSEAPVHITPKQDAAVLRKVDKWLLPVMLMVYFLQQLDKLSLSYTSIFGIVANTNLIGLQYSWLGSIVLLVGKYLFVNVFMWGVVVSCTTAAHNFNGLITTWFFLGIFEATIAPSFITITQMWWRRRKQTMHLSLWMAMNGVTGMFRSLLAFGIGHIQGSIKPYQKIFLFIGLLTLFLSPIVYFVLPDLPTTAKFLLHNEKIVALEWLRTNNQGTESKTWEWSQVGFGFNQIPFGAFQVIITLSSAAIATKIKLKWPVLLFLTLPPITGAAALYKLGRKPELRNKLLGCYYVLSFFTGIQPMLYTWSSQNTAGHTKKTCTTGIVFVAQCAGNIVGPLLYKTADAPYYHRGLITNLICWGALAVLTLLTALYLSFLNRQHTAARRCAGKKAEVINTSLEDSKIAHQATRLNKGGSEGGIGQQLNNQAFNDLTDLRNEDFIYVL